MNLGQKHGMTDQIVGMIKEKLQDWFKNLSDDEKAKFNGLNVNFLADQLMYVDNNESSIKKMTKRKSKKMIQVIVIISFFFDIAFLYPNY